MIGSVHGCVSCPVVVRPWEPESLSRPQHPHPSHPNPQSQTYSFSQRSSSVHPFPQEINPDDKKSGKSLWPQKHVGDQSYYENELVTSAETVPPKPGSPAKMVSAKESLRKTGADTDSPGKTLSVFRSQQAISEQYEQLLGPQTVDIINVNASSQKIVAFQSSSPGDDYCRNTESGQGRVHYVESQVKESELDCSPSKFIDKSKRQPVYSDEKVSHTSEVLPKDRTLQSSSPVSEPLSNSSGIGSAQFQGLSPSLLPSIQDRSKMLTRGELSRELSQVSLLTSLRPNKVLPSIPNPKLQPLKKAAFLPPRPSLSLRKEKKQQVPAPRKKKSGKLDESAGGSIRKTKLGQKGKQKCPGSQATSLDTAPQLSAATNKTASTASTDSVTQQYRNVPDFSLQRKIEGASDTFVEAATSPPHPPRHDTTTPQSFDSSVWSFGQNAVAPEVDALTTAAAAGDVKKVRSLIAKGVNVNAVNTFGRTAVQVMSVNNTELAEVLLKAGADPNMQDKGRRAATSTLRTIAHDVADSGNADMLRCLLRYGADVNLQDRWGNTPLHLAAKGGHLAAVRLLRRGTSLYLRNFNGKTPIMLLEEKDDSAIKEWVRMKKSTVSHLHTLCVLALRRQLGPEGLRHWRKHTSDTNLQRQVLLETQGLWPHPCASTSTMASSQHSAGSRSLVARGRGNGNTHPLLPGMSTGKQMTDFLTLRDLIPRRLSTGENTSLEVHNNSSGQSYDDVSFGAHATSSLASEAGSLFEANLSSIEASQSADDVSLPSFDQSL